MKTIIIVGQKKYEIRPETSFQTPSRHSVDFTQEGGSEVTRVVESLDGNGMIAQIKGYSDWFDAQEI